MEKNPKYPSQQIEIFKVIFDRIPSMADNLLSIGGMSSGRSTFLLPNLDKLLSKGVISANIWVCLLFLRVCLHTPNVKGYFNVRLPNLT